MRGYMHVTHTHLKKQKARSFKHIHDTHIGIHTYIVAYIQTYRHTDIHTYTYIHTYIHTYIPTYIHTVNRSYINIHEHTHKHKRKRTHMHTHTRKQESEGSESLCLLASAQDQLLSGLSVLGLRSLAEPEGERGHGNEWSKEGRAGELIDEIGRFRLCIRDAAKKGDCAGMLFVSWVLLCVSQELARMHDRHRSFSYGNMVTVRVWFCMYDVYHYCTHACKALCEAVPCVCVCMIVLFDRTDFCGCDFVCTCVDTCTLVHIRT